MTEPSMLYKLIVLFMLESSRRPLSNSQISEFMLEKEYTNYFQIQETISDLVESGLLLSEKVRNSTNYQPSEKGITTLSYFRSEISPEIKKEVQAYLNELGVKNAVCAQSEYYEIAHGNYTVHCQLLERGVSKLELNVVMPSKEAADAVKKNWKKKAMDIYADLMEELM